MGASRGLGTQLVGFLSDVQARGATEALRALNLGSLAGRPLPEVFLGLADYVCPNSGTIDDGIAREAFVETVIELTELGWTDLDALTPEQMQLVFELYVTRSIEARLCNDIGTKMVAIPADAKAVISVEAQLRDFIQNAVSDAVVETLQNGAGTLPHERVRDFVDGVYERAFGFLQQLGESEAER